MRQSREKVETVTVGMNAELCGKLRKVCKERGLRFPDDLSFLLREVCTPNVAKV